MAKNKKLPNHLTDTAKWYQEVVLQAELAEHSPVKGCMVIRPYGFALWELIRDELDRYIKERGVVNTSFPTFIPESYLAREKDHVEGFAPECAVVTHAGGKKLEEPLIVRPTSETIIHESMSRWINSYRDLPMKINQWGSVFRWEKRTRFFLRNREFLWQEGHTAHATEEEARREVQEALEMYRVYTESTVAVPSICGVKSESEKFAGAVESSSTEGLMINGKGLQLCTIHYLGENFSKMANVKFLDKDGSQKFVQMTSWGTSTRLIGALILTHGDEKGLVLPPKVAPIQVVIVPIGLDKEPRLVGAATERVARQLRGYGLRVSIDDREDMSPGAKFYHWELRGVPLRIEIGPRDVKTNTIMCAWRTSFGKEMLTMDNLIRIPKKLEDYQDNLLEKAIQSVYSRTITASSRDEFCKLIESQAGFIRASWCGSAVCEQGIKNATGATSLNMPLHEQKDVGDCIWCGKKGQNNVYFAKAY